MPPCLFQSTPAIYLPCKGKPHEYFLGSHGTQWHIYTTTLDIQENWKHTLYHRSLQNLVSLWAGMRKVVLIWKLAAIPNSTAPSLLLTGVLLTLFFTLVTHGRRLKYRFASYAPFLLYAKLYLDQIPASSLPYLVVAHTITLYAIPKYKYHHLFLNPFSGSPNSQTKA